MQKTKSVAVALLFSVFLGPIGLLYASFWGGVIMLPLAVVVISSRFVFPIFIMWAICCIWAVGAVEANNRQASV